jgi:DNA-damage-inducible protein D
MDKNNSFDNIKHLNQDNNEFWYARELMSILGYSKWDNFTVVISKAKDSCITSGGVLVDHFTNTRKMVMIGSGAKRVIDDSRLSRYACYLIAQNGDSSKKQIALAQSYFAQQTRRQELDQQEIVDKKRLDARLKLTNTEKRFSSTILEREVDTKGLAKIRSMGDKKLFGGKTTAEMKRKYEIKPRIPLADVLPTISLKAKDLAAEMTIHNTENLNLVGEKRIIGEHLQSNREVRTALLSRGIKLEDLPPEEDIQKVARRLSIDKKKPR